MAGSITLGNEYTASGMSAGLKSVTKRCTITTLTDADALDTGIDIPAGAMPLTCAMKVIQGCDKVSTLSVGVSGTAAGYMSTHSVAAAAEGTVHKDGAAALLGVKVASTASILLTGAVTSGPATVDVIVDLEIVYAYTSMA